MTGFGIATVEDENFKITVEIKSLNSKFLELNLKYPKSISDKELIIRNLCNKEIERGKASINISLERNSDEVKGATINATRFKDYFHQLDKLSKELQSDHTNLFSAILNLPEVIDYQEEVADEKEWGQLQIVMAKALQNFNQFRMDEGIVLEADLVLRVQNIMNFFDKVVELAPLRIPQIRSRLTLLLEEYVGKTNFDQNRLEQELIFYIDKLDITEEQTRLKSHCNYFLETLKSKDTNGKKLGFITQEMGREINTMGSKANDADIQKLVVGMKEELEKIKEQLLNIL